MESNFHLLRCSVRSRRCVSALTPFRVYGLSHVMCFGCGCVSPGKLLPRCGDTSQKILCVNHSALCDMGKPGKICGWSGEDPTQCILCDGKVLFLAGEQSCYFEVSSPRLKLWQSATINLQLSLSDLVVNLQLSSIQSNVPNLQLST